MSRTIVFYLVLALLFALLLLWLLVRFLACCCSPIDAAFCQLASSRAALHIAFQRDFPLDLLPPVAEWYPRYAALLSAVCVGVVGIKRGSTRGKINQEQGTFKTITKPDFNLLPTMASGQLDLWLIHPIWRGGELASPYPKDNLRTISRR